MTNDKQGGRPPHPSPPELRPRARKPLFPVPGGAIRVEAALAMARVLLDAGRAEARRAVAPPTDALVTGSSPARRAGEEGRS